MRRIALILGLLSLGVLAAGAQEFVVVTEEWPPYRINDPDAPQGFRGIDIDLLEALADELGITFAVERHPFARALDMIRTGEADIITGIAYTAERDEYIAYVPTSYSAVQPVFYTQSGRGNDIRTYDDLSGLEIGYSLNSAYFEPFNSDAELTKVGVATEIQLLRMVALGRLDVTIGTDPNISYDAVRLGLSGQVEPTAYVPDAATPLYVGISPRGSAQDLVDDFDAAIAALIDTGRVQEILNEYR